MSEIKSDEATAPEVSKPKYTKRERRAKDGPDYSRNGLIALKARVMVRGLSVVDKRSAAAKALLSWKRELLNALGGEANVSPQRLALVDMICRTRLYVDHLDAFLMEQRSLVNKRKRAVVPVLHQRQLIVDSLARLLSQLGLEKIPAPVKSLAEYVASRQSESPTVETS